MTEPGPVPLSLPENPEPGQLPLPGFSTPPEVKLPRPDSRPCRLPAASDSQKIVASGAAEQDRALEHQLVFIVSNLEFCRAQISEQETRPQPADILTIATAMVDQVEGGAAKRLGSRADPQALEKAQARASAFHASVQTFSREVGSPSLWQTLVGFFRKSTLTEKERQQRFRQLTGGLVEVLDNFFQVYKTAFHAPEAADSWAQTYTIFLTDLIQVLDRLHY
jgi:hypothetical protein